MTYKALFLDVDGTVIPYKYDALPSDTLAAAIKKVQEKVTVCLITGRSYGFTQPILEKLQIKSGYAVVNTGAVIVDLSDESVVHSLPINRSDMEEIVTVLNAEQVTFYLKDSALGKSHGLDLELFTNNKIPDSTFMILTDEKYPGEKIDTILQKLSHLPTLNMHKTSHKDPTKFGINITHINATKLHGVQFLLKKLDLQREEVIGVGDSYNDFPLLMASGLKVAMGNAIGDLKAIADYIAPPVTEDGVVNVIEKFIFKNR